MNGLLFDQTDQLVSKADSLLGTRTASCLTRQPTRACTPTDSKVLAVFHCSSSWLLCLPTISLDANKMETDPLVSKGNPLLHAYTASCQIRLNKGLGSVSLPVGLAP
ncbi:hypothetical protein SK128_004163, partial [Halocaridina rubra]